MSTSNQLQQLKELLVLLTERLEVLKKNNLHASSQVMERRIKETKAAINKAEKVARK